MDDYWDWWNRYYKERDLSSQRNKFIESVHELTKIGWDAAMAAVADDRKLKDQEESEQENRENMEEQERRDKKAI